MLRLKALLLRDVQANWAAPDRTIHKARLVKPAKPMPLVAINGRLTVLCGRG